MALVWKWSKREKDYVLVRQRKGDTLRARLARRAAASRRLRDSKGRFRRARKPAQPTPRVAQIPKG